MIYSREGKFAAFSAAHIKKGDIIMNSINYRMPTLLLLISVMAFAVFASASYAGKTQSLSDLRDVFDNYGCSGCHTYMYKNSTSGPSIAAIAGLAKFKTKKWVISWIMDPKKHYNEPDVKAMIRAYNEYMPNNGVNKADSEKIYQYLMRIAAKSSKEKK